MVALDEIKSRFINRTSSAKNAIYVDVVKWDNSVNLRILFKIISCLQKRGLKLLKEAIAEYPASSDSIVSPLRRHALTNEKNWPSTGENA